MSRHVLAVLVLCSFAGLAAAQGLGDAARKESERRSRAKGSSKDAGKASGKVYTGDDLRHGAPEPQPEPPAVTPEAGPPSELEGLELPPGQPGPGDVPPSSSAGTSASPTGTSGPGPGGQSEYRWRNRAKSLTENITRLEREVDLADREATGYATEGPVDRNGRPSTRHPRAMARAQGARRALENARKAYADFEEEARRAGVPPGWLR